jgi:hypothetical protein
MGRGRVERPGGGETTAMRTARLPGLMVARISGG